MTDYKLPELQSKEAIKTSQDAIKKSLTKLDMAIHNNAVQCLMHAEKHGDTSLMRRLLIDIVDTKTGYRRQGIIGWMRLYSPMELKGDVINLSGTLPDGTRRPFKVEEADKTPFWHNKKLDEKLATPVYQDTILSPINKAIKSFREAVNNTQDGKPIDASKPFYDGIHLDKVTAFFDGLETNVVDLARFKDQTKDVREAQRVLREANAA